MESYQLLLAILTTYGLATLLSEYDGMFDLFVKLRRFKLFQCNVCLSPYLAIIPTIALDLTIIGYLATIGAVVFLARIS